MTKKQTEQAKIQPAPGYVLLKPMEAQTKTSSGIYLPDTAKEKSTIGLVIAVGEEIPGPGGKIVSPAKKGEKVIYKEWGGNKIKIDGEELMFAKFEEILGVIK